MATYSLELSFQPGKYSEKDKKGSPLGPRAHIVLKRYSTQELPVAGKKKQKRIVLGLNPLMCAEESDAVIDGFIKEFEALKPKLRKLFREDKKRWQAWRESPLGSGGKESKN